jgi:hypothetical protein
MICNTVRAKKPGRMALQGTQGNSTKERNMGKADLTGKMVATMKETLSKASLKDLESTTLQILTRYTKENSGIAQWRVKVRKSGQMVRDMKVISRMERKTEKGHSNGQTGINILDHGNKENNME